MQKTILILLLLAASINLKAQNFKLGLVSGVNISKFGSNEIVKQPYNHFGHKLGGRVGIDIKRRVRTSIDILYSRKGNVTELGGYTLPYKKLRLDYIDIPFMLTYLDWMEDPDEEDYYKLHFSIGAAYARLINHLAINNLDVDITNQSSFNKSDWSVLAGLTYYPSEHFGINLQYSYSLPNLVELEVLPKMKHRNWSVIFLYMFNNKRRLY